jgi:hypothetical protein
VRCLRFTAASAGQATHRVEAHEDESVKTRVVNHVLVGNVEEEANPAARGQRREAPRSRVLVRQRRQRRHARLLLGVGDVGSRFVGRVSLLLSNRKQRTRAEQLGCKRRRHAQDAERSEGKRSDDRVRRERILKRASLRAPGVSAVKERRKRSLKRTVKCLSSTAKSVARANKGPGGAAMPAQYHQRPGKRCGGQL